MQVLVLLHLSLLLSCISTTVYGGDATLDNQHPPIKPPTRPPPPPVGKPLAVQGVVYCKPCKYKGVDTLVDASPLEKAVVKLQCNNTKHVLEEQAETDKNGYFLYMPAQNVTTMGYHKCKVFLVSSPLANCSVPTNLNGGADGAILIHDRKPTTSLYPLFNVGPFAFDSPNY